MLDDDLRLLKYDELVELLQILRPFFKSGNEVPVDRAIIRRVDWDPIENMLKEFD